MSARVNASFSMSEVPPTIVLIAHDGRKADISSLALKNAELLRRYRMVATGTTGKMLEDQIGLDVHRYRSGSLAGGVQIAAQIVEGNIFTLIFFVEPPDKYPHEPNIQTLLRACNVHDVPVATNEATARYIIARGTVQDVADPGELKDGSAA